MANVLTAFIDDVAVGLRAAEVPNASFGDGMNVGGSCACGIGIGSDNPGLEEQLPNWTLLDQHGNGRLGQISQHIGGPGYTDFNDYPSSGGQEGTLPDSIIRTGPNNADGTGNVVYTGDMHLISLATGWEVVAP